MTHLLSLQDLATRNGGVVTRRETVAAGVPDSFLRTAVERGMLARLARGVYAVGGRTVESPRVITERYKVVLSHASAAAFYGVDCPRPIRKPHVTASRNRGRRRRDITDAQLHRSNLAAYEVIVLRGVRLTAPLRTAIDIARSETLEYAVPVVDSFIRKGFFGLDEFMAAARAVMGPGSARVTQVCALIDAQSGSVLESLTRVLLWRNEITSPATQFNLRDRPSNWRGRLDFAWPELAVGLECDGFDFHVDREQFQKDRRRWSTLTRMGWRLIAVTWFDVTQDPTYVIRLVRDVLQAARDQHTKPLTLAA